MALDPSMPILVVDDFPLVAAMIAALLRDEGFSNVETAHSGHQATEKLSRRAYSLIISDLRMPEMSGLDLFTAITQSELVEKPRFIIVTASKNLANLTSSPGAGVDAVLEKPVTSARLKATIEAVLSRPAALVA